MDSPEFVWNRRMHNVTETELAVLKTLWSGGPQTARQITEELYPDCTASDIGTVHSMLQRLERKKLIRRSRRTHPHLFSAKVSMADVAGQELDVMAEKLSEGSMAPFLMHLLSAGRMTREEAAEIRDMLSNYTPRDG